MGAGEKLEIVGGVGGRWTVRRPAGRQRRRAVRRDNTEYDRDRATAASAVPERVLAAITGIV